MERERSLSVSYKATCVVGTVVVLAGSFVYQKKTVYEIISGVESSKMCIKDSTGSVQFPTDAFNGRKKNSPKKSA